MNSRFISILWTKKIRVYSQYLYEIPIGEKDLSKHIYTHTYILFPFASFTPNLASIPWERENNKSREQLELFSQIFITNIILFCFDYFIPLQLRIAQMRPLLSFILDCIPYPTGFHLTLKQITLFSKAPFPMWLIPSCV